MKPHRPDLIIFIMAYLALVALGGIFGGLLLFIIVLPAVMDLGEFFQPYTLVMAFLGLVALGFAVLALLLMAGLWKGTAAARAGTMILSAILALISALAMPTLLFVGIAGIALVPPLITAVLLTIASAGVLFALTRPAVRAYFE